MLTRSSIYALAAVAALGVTALATSSASARPMGPMGMKVPAHGPMGVSVKPHAQGLVICKPHIRSVSGSRRIQAEADRGHHHQPEAALAADGQLVQVALLRPALGAGGDRRRRHRRRKPPSRPLPIAPAQSCTCLTKTYLQDGSVQFKDVCTTEAAIASPAQLGAQAPGVGPQVQ